MTKSEQYLEILGKMVETIKYEAKPMQMIGNYDPMKDPAVRQLENMLSAARRNANAAMMESLAFDHRQARIEHARGLMDMARHRFFEAKSQEDRDKYQAEYEEANKNLQAIYDETEL